MTYMCQGQNQYLGGHDKLTDDQIAHISNWNRIGWDEEPRAAMHIIHVVPSNGSTATSVNIVEPASQGWVDPPGGYGTLVPAGRRPC